ncbi:hypothetical protein [Mycolicibacter minnesotensis]
MTGTTPDPRDAETRPISVAELLAKNGTIGSPPVTGRRRRRRGNADAVTVAELTGEIPIIRDDQPPPEPKKPSGDSAETGALRTGKSPGSVEEDRPAPAPRPAERAEPTTRPAERAERATRPAERPEPKTPSAPEQRWPKSPQQPSHGTGPLQSAYPRPLRRSDPPAVDKSRPAADIGSTGSGAERMRPDPVGTYVELDVGGLDSDVRDVDLPAGDSALVRSLLAQGDVTERILSPAVGADTATQDRDAAGDLDPATEAVEHYVARPGVVGAALVVLQSILAVAFGGGLFIAFDQLWRWNSIVALVLTVLVTLGLVAAVQAVRKTVDIGSTLIAVAVGLLVTLGPLALHAN